MPTCARACVRVWAEGMQAEAEGKAAARRARRLPLSPYDALFQPAGILLNFMEFYTHCYFSFSYTVALRCIVLIRYDILHYLPLH
jgi:hypothetical protein